MEHSIRDAKARFTEAAAASGERVIVTKHGRPFIELVAAHPASGMDFEAHEGPRFSELPNTGLTLERIEFAPATSGFTPGS